MNIHRRPKLIVLGMLSKMPVGGVFWQLGQYVEGFRRNGYDVYYVEAHARTPTMLMTGSIDEATSAAAELIERFANRFGLAGRWAYHALHHDGRVYGMSESALRHLYQEAAIIVNLHGGTAPRQEFKGSAALILIDTDPGAMQVNLHRGDPRTIEFVSRHDVLFSFAENLGKAGCGLPVTPGFDFRPTRQPIACDWWDGGKSAPPGPAAAFTTIGNWEQPWRQIDYQGKTYFWSKHLEFKKFLDLPRRTAGCGARFELALASLSDNDRELLLENGWAVRPAMPFSMDADAYRQFIIDSRAEFTVAKDQNIRLGTGWFSDRSAAYLAAGRPVVAQDTAFGAVIPTGVGLISYQTPDEAAAAVAAVMAEYDKHSQAAGELAREFFACEKVTGEIVKLVT